MRELLLVCAAHDPDEAADNRRVVQLVSRLRPLGWNPRVAAVASSADSTYADDPDSVRRARPLPAMPGVSAPALRGAFALDRLVRAWHRERPFDLALFSNTAFPLWRLALRWRERLALPYVLDWQDPWWSDYHDRHPALPRPGGAFKYAVMQWLARRWEPPVTRAASAHIAVSSAYPAMLRSRYPDVPAERFSTIPFAFDNGDLRRAAARDAPLPSFGPRYWLYAGRGGDDMAFACRVFFRALAVARTISPSRFEGLRIAFVGTDYAADGRARQTIAPLAQAAGIGDLVTELPARVPYLDALRLMNAAEALFVPGSDDATYSASKLNPYLATGKPLISIHTATGDMARILAGQPGVSSFAFADTTEATCLQLSRKIADGFLADEHRGRAFARSLREGDADTMARRVVDVLDEVVT